MKRHRPTFQKYIIVLVLSAKFLRIEVDLSALKRHVKCELSGMIRKIELLINGASDSCLWKSCENIKENLSFLQKELLAKKVITRDSNSNSKLTIKFTISASILFIIA